MQNTLSIQVLNPKGLGAPSSSDSEVSYPALSLDKLLADGEWLLAAGMKNAALEHFRCAVKLDRKSTPAWLGVARATGDTDEAIEALGEVLALDPENLEARNLRLALQVGNLRAELPVEAEEPISPVRRFMIPLLITLVVLVWFVVVLLARDYLLSALGRFFS